MKKQMRPAFAAAAAAFVLPLFGTAAEPVTSVPLVHRYVAGEHLAYESRMTISGPHLKAKRQGHYFVDVDANDVSHAYVRIEQDGKTNLPIAITIKPDGSWLRGDGHSVPAIGEYDPSVMCGHATATVHAGESWSCHIDGVFQYLGPAQPEPGNVRVTVIRIVPPKTAELNVSYRSDPYRETTTDDDTHQDITIVRQTIKTTTLLLDDGIATSIADHTQIGTSYGGSPPAVVEVNATKTLTEHRPK